MTQARDHQPTMRFADRVADYQRYRPGYPPELTRWLMQVAGLKPGDAVADIGAGTGLFTRDLLAAGLRVFAVEPNAPMRAAGARALAGRGDCRFVDGTAEHTGLADASVRMVCAAQAFHWFDPPTARAEFARILTRSDDDGGGAALIWNVRRLEGAFAEAYEALLLRRCPDYAAGMPAQARTGDVADFFAPSKFVDARFDYVQRFDLDGLRGRLLSSSYTPAADDPRRGPLLEDLAALFAEHAVDDAVRFEYDTRVFFGAL